MVESVGILHPGEMGIPIAESAQNSEYSVFFGLLNPQTHKSARGEKLTHRRKNFATSARTDTSI